MLIQIWISIFSNLCFQNEVPLRNNKQEKRVAHVSLLHVNQTFTIEKESKIHYYIIQRTLINEWLAHLYDPI